MAEKIYNITCNNPQCKNHFKVKVKEGMSAFSVTCPACSKKMNVKLPQQPDILKVVASDANVKKMQLTCPNDKHKFFVQHPDKSGVFKAVCPQCNSGYNVMVKEAANDNGVATSPKAGVSQNAAEAPKKPTEIPTKIPTDPVTGMLPLGGKLVLLRKLGKNKEFILKDGPNVIGRKDEALHSDIEVSGDSSMSRRSVQIEKVRVADSCGYMFKMQVLKSTNPVLLNNKVVNYGEIKLLSFNDIIILGQTKFRFDKV